MGGIPLILLDIDVSVLVDRHSQMKRVTWMHMNVPGYAPILCCAGTGDAWSPASSYWGTATADAVPWSP